MGDIIAIGLIALVLGLAIYKMRKNKKTNSCGCGCQGCSQKNQCGK